MYIIKRKVIKTMRKCDLDIFVVQLYKNNTEWKQMKFRSAELAERYVLYVNKDIYAVENNVTAKFLNPEG